MRISVIIVNYNVKYFLEVCLHAVYRALEGISGEVIVVDNNSTDGSPKYIRERFPSVTLIENRDNTGFSKANNQGVEIAKGEYILFLNPDTVVPEDFFSSLLAYMDAHPEAGSIGPRLIDGKGQYAPDSKKSFPSFSVALFKGTGLHKLFPKSKVFNRYYAVHIGEHEIAPVEVLSGCCMMVRKTALTQLGYAFDEQFFMYFEDGDLCYRLYKAGYQNIYYPKVTVIHYKGESTRKATLAYIRIFNEALSLFVRKHYSKKNAQIFILLIHLGIFVKSTLSVIKICFQKLKMPLIDAILLLAALFVVKDYFIPHSEIGVETSVSKLLTLPIYTLLWLTSLYLNGAYDPFYRTSRVLRGMMVGTLLCLAYTFCLSENTQPAYSLLLLSAAIGSLGLILWRELFSRKGISGEKSTAQPVKAVIVSEPACFEETQSMLRKIPFAPEVLGRVSIQPESETGALSTLNTMKPVAEAAGVQEVIFCIQQLGYKEMMAEMENCGAAYDYKIHLPGSRSFVGSNSSDTAGDLYTADIRYNLSGFASKRNKRILDLWVSFCMLALSPFLCWFVKSPLGLLRNSLQVLLGKYTWVGYGVHTLDNKHLPHIRSGVLPPWYIVKGFQPNAQLIALLDQQYAMDYNTRKDLHLILKNFRFCGENPGKDFVKKES